MARETVFFNNKPKIISTASVLVAYARAAARLCNEGSFGAKTVLDIPPAYLHSEDAATLRKKLL